MNFTEFNYFLTIFLLNNMIIKINACKIEHKPNIGIIVLDCDNIIKNKSK